MMILRVQEDLLIGFKTRYIACRIITIVTVNCDTMNKERKYMWTKKIQSKQLLRLFANKSDNLINIMITYFAIHPFTVPLSHLKTHRVHFISTCSLYLFCTIILPYYHCVQRGFN